MPSERLIGRRHLEGRALILQVTKCCQWRHKFAITLKDLFTFGTVEWTAFTPDEPARCAGFPALRAQCIIPQAKSEEIRQSEAMLLINFGGI
jgi:hypothetical protein